MVFRQELQTEGTHMKRLWFVILLFPSLAGAQVIPTSEWISVWSDSTTFNKGDIQPGAVVRAYDPHGVLCGEFTVTSAGDYGLMPVYRDDPLTLVDEGADPGDAIVFAVDGAPATAHGPDAATWTFDGDIKEIHLSYEKVVPTSEWVSFWSDASTVRTAPVSVGAVVRAYDPGGVLCGGFVVHTEGDYGLMPVYRDDPLTPQVDEGADPGDVISFTIDGETAGSLGPDDTIWGSNGEVKNVDIDVAGVATRLAGSRVTVEGRAVTVAWRFQDPIDVAQLSVWRRTQTANGAAAFVVLERATISRRGAEYSFTDADVRAGERYAYRVEIKDSKERQFLDLGGIRVPAGRFVLYPNHPNPFRDGTTIEFELPERSNLTLTVYDVQGRVVRRLAEGVHPADSYQVEWDGLDESGARAAKGVYFLKLKAGAREAVLKLTFVR